MSICSSINCPTVICSPTVCYFFSREATSETYGPRVSFIMFTFAIYFPLPLFLDLLNQKYKNTLLQFIHSAIYLSYLPLLPHVICLSWATVPKRDWQPLLHVGLRVFVICVQVLFTCCEEFSYWFDNLGLITEGNIYRCYTTSSLPLWGNTDVVLADIKRNFWCRCRGGSLTSTRFLITNLIS